MNQSWCVITSRPIMIKCKSFFLENPVFFHHCIILYIECLTEWCTGLTSIRLLVFLLQQWQWVLPQSESGEPGQRRVTLGTELCPRLITPRYFILYPISWFFFKQCSNMRNIILIKWGNICKKERFKFYDIGVSQMIRPSLPWISIVSADWEQNTL